MIGNEVSLTNIKDLKVIYGVNNEIDSIKIGYSILENQPISLSINKFFASHIGIFGNTGSGKSNTLHKLYLELFNSEYYERIVEKSQFFVIDFNGEYTSPDINEKTQRGIFGVHECNKTLFEINTRNEDKSSKIPIKKRVFI